jgi:hypothetical protein
VLSKPAERITEEQAHNKLVCGVASWISTV